MASYGVTCNISYTNNDDVLELGVHLTDSEGLDVSTQAESDDVTSLIDSVCADLMAGIIEQSTDEPEEVDEIQRLKDENERLQAQIEQLQNKTKETKSTDSTPKVTVSPKSKGTLEEVMEKMEKILSDRGYDFDDLPPKTPKSPKVDKDSPFNNLTKYVTTPDIGYWDVISSGKNIFD